MRRAGGQSVGWADGDCSCCLVRSLAEISLEYIDNVYKQKRLVRVGITGASDGRERRKRYDKISISRI